MDKCIVEENKNDNAIVGQKVERNLWREIISQSGNRNNKFDNRSQVVFDALREKLEIKYQVKDKSDIESQLEKSESHLKELTNFGNELVNNIKCANEKHELLHSQDKAHKEAELLANLHQEAQISLRQLDEINKKWMDMNSLNEPMAIYEEMQKQRENIANLMTSKDELIDQCQQELKRINQKYYDDQNKMSQDICFLVERIDYQIELLKKSYRKHIHDLLYTIEMEKEKILQTAQEKWNIVYDHLTVDETKKTEMVKEKRNYYIQEGESMRNRQEEITRTTRIRMEKDAELLELEIRKIRANILMNSEKIDYNYQVLQKRNEENIIINNQQKRRLAKFNDSIAILKRKLHDLRENNRQTMERLTQDIQKLHANINELQTKAEHFRKNNRLKLYKVWNINFKEIVLLIKRVFEIDRILYEQQLGRKWTVPKFDLNELDYTQETDRNVSLIEMDKYLVKHEAVKIKSNIVTWSERQLHDILHKISDRAGFLVEEKLLQILKPHTKEENCLVKIENIFSALNIKDIGKVKSLTKYFEPYSWCANCSAGPTKSSLKSLYSFNRQPNNLKVFDSESNNENSKTNEHERVCNNHVLCMEPALVLTALNEFVTNQMEKNSKSLEMRDHKLAMDLFSFDKTQIINYWQQFSLYMTMEQQNVWKSIEHGLNHYLEILKKRAQIDRECMFLQKQNAELKYLLQKL